MGSTNGGTGSEYLVTKIKGAISKIGRQNFFGLAGKNSAMPQANIRYIEELVTIW